MTDERNTNDIGKVDDRLVSEAYREAATERAPQHLDAAVLRTAAAAARPRYSLLRSWTRPVAWAAVVMLSFALVLELTQTPVPQAGNEMLMAPAEVAQPDAERRLDRQLDEYEALDDSAAADLSKRERDKEDFQELKVMDADMLQRAEEMARVQQGPSDAPQPASAEPVAVGSFSADADLAEEVVAPAVMPLPEKSALRSAAGHIDMEAGCEESARVEPESWMACIEALEEAGQAEVAAAERQLLQAAFPDFTD